MDKVVANTFQKIMKDGEKKAPVKSIKLKVKFDTREKEKKKKDMARRMNRNLPSPLKK